MRFMSIVILCCLATLACCSSLAEDETLNDFLENFEREEMIKELKDEVAKRRKGLVRKPLVQITPEKLPVKPLPVSSPCSNPCCDTRKTRVDLGDLNPGVVNGMPNVLKVIEPPGSGSQCSKQALLKVTFEKITKEPCAGICMESPFCGRRLLRIDLELSRTRRPSGDQRLFDIGDSASNDGYGGDGNDLKYDAEADGQGHNINVYGNDHCKPVSKLFPFNNAIAPNVNHVTIWIGNEYIRVTNDAGFDKHVCSDCLYALNGQPDATVNQDIYVALNRVVSGRKDRDGVGVCGATLSWECGWH